MMSKNLPPNGPSAPRPIKSKEKNYMTIETLKKNIDEIMMLRKLQAKIDMKKFEAVIENLRIYGHQLDRDFNCKMNKVFDMLQNVSQDERIDLKIRFAIKNIIYMRSRHWMEFGNNENDGAKDNMLPLSKIGTKVHDKDVVVNEHNKIVHNSATAKELKPMSLSKSVSHNNENLLQKDAPIIVNKKLLSGELVKVQKNEQIHRLATEDSTENTINQLRKTENVKNTYPITTNKSKTHDENLKFSTINELETKLNDLNLKKTEKVADSVVAENMSPVKPIGKHIVRVGNKEIEVYSDDSELADYAKEVLEIYFNPTKLNPRYSVFGVNEGPEPKLDKSDNGRNRKRFFTRYDFESANDNDLQNKNHKKHAQKEHELKEKIYVYTREELISLNNSAAPSNLATLKPAPQDYFGKRL